jgi:hypothetical protein
MAGAGSGPTDSSSYLGVGVVMHVGALAVAVEDHDEFCGLVDGGGG